MIPKVCLINPPHPYLTNPGSQAPLGLLYIASMLRQRGFEFDFLNLTDKVIKEGFEDDRDGIYFPEAHVYGITGTILDVKSVHQVARKIRKQHEGVRIILGGPITLSPQYIDDSLIDALCIGEGEYEIFNILKDYPRFKRQYVAERIKDLDVLPFPARDLLGDHLGDSVFVGGKSHYSGGTTVIATSRGCPFNCVYCASPKIWKRKLVYRSPENIREEVKEIVEKHGVRQLRFSDDNVTCNKYMLDELCGCLEDYKIAWRASIRVNPHNIEIFEKMKRGGCAEVCFGIESFDQNVLDALRKRVTVEDNKEAIINAKKSGLDVRILFMTGTPGERTDTVDKNIEALEEIKDYYDGIAITNFTPLPGSFVADDPVRCGCELMGEHNIEKYNLCLWGPEGRNTWVNHVRPVGLTCEQLTNNKERMVEYVLNTGRSNHG